MSKPMDLLEVIDTTVCPQSMCGYPSEDWWEINDNIPDLSFIAEEVNIEDHIHSDVNSTEDLFKIEDLVSNIPMKRPRGRPPITDPTVRDRNKRKSQMKASINYRQKQRQKSIEIKEEMIQTFDENQNKKQDFNELSLNCRHYLKLCLQFESKLNDNEKQRLIEIQDQLNSLQNPL